MTIALQQLPCFLQTLLFQRCNGLVDKIQGCINVATAMYFRNIGISTLQWSCILKTWSYHRCNGRVFLKHDHFNAAKVVPVAGMTKSMTRRSSLGWE
jgi:hypothetical protein